MDRTVTMENVETDSNGRDPIITITALTNLRKPPQSKAPPPRYSN